MSQESFNSKEFITFFIPGEPVAKGRARSFVRNGVISHYTPQKTSSYEKLVAKIASVKMAGKKLLLTPVSMKIIACFKIPESWSKKKQKLAQEGKILPAKKPDIDNCLKAVNDSLNGIVWKDDCQVVECFMKKIFSMEPGVQVTISDVTV